MQVLNSRYWTREARDTEMNDQAVLLGAHGCQDKSCQSHQGTLGTKSIDRVLP